ncbi:MAG: HAD family hydrolase [Gemmatimonadetes bacterium]|nr:HAD family hydrolase [Gemmatimonadota bacterium]
MYRLIALDIDGTLLDGSREMSDATVDAVHYAIESGVQVTVCTGRSLPSAADAVRHLPLNAPYVLNNGAMIYDVPNHRARYLRHLPSHVALDAVRVFRSIGFHPIVYGPLPEVGYFYYDSFDPDNQSFVDYAEQNADRVHRVDDVCDFLRQDITCITVAERNERVRSRESHIRGQLPDAQVVFEISPWDRRYSVITVMPSGVTKGEGLRRLALLLGIGLSEVMAVGDNLNDLEMLDVAGLGVAMGNGTPEIRARADYVTATVDDEGVARAIERFIL